LTALLDAAEPHTADVKWLRRILVLGLVVSLLGVLAVAGLVLKVRSDHPRSETDFFHGLRGLSVGGRQAFEPIDHGFLLAEGDKACDWLRDQPYPLWRGDDRFRFSEMLNRYGREHPPSKEDWTQGDLDPHFRQILVVSAWVNLCGDARELRRTPFNGPATDD
jgi:hypothetical protein